MTARRLKRILDWAEINWSVDELVQKLDGNQYDLLLVITRGGMVPAGLLSERLNIRNIVVAAVQHHRRSGESLEEPVFFQFPAEDLLNGSAVLIVDDVWESGRTAVAVRNRVRQHADRADLAVLHYKPGWSNFAEQQPDFYAEMTDDWIIYPWDPEDSVHA